MSSISVDVSRDGLTASLLVTGAADEEYPDRNRLRAALLRRRVVHGIQEDAIDAMVEEKVINRRVVAAKGKAPVHGIAGKLELLVDLSERGKPRQLSGGRVDHRDLRKIINVSEGQELIRHVPPVPGKPGLTVLGAEMQPPEPKDVSLPIGPGTCVSEQQPDILVAEYSGALVVDSRGEVRVTKTRTLGGDVDYNTGNVQIDGDLSIRGTVRAGFTVRAEGKIRIAGNVEDACVTAGSDLSVGGGAVGAGKGVLRAGGSISVHHVERFTIESEKDIAITGHCLHANLYAAGSVKAKSIVGGTVTVGEELSAVEIGGAAETKTVVDIGAGRAVLEEKMNILRKIGHLAGEIGETREKWYALVRDGMDAQGHLSREQETLVEEFRESSREMKARYAELEGRAEDLEEKIRGMTPPVVTARHIHPNTVIRYGTNEKRVQRNENNVRITVADNVICFE